MSSVGRINSGLSGIKEVVGIGKSRAILRGILSWMVARLFSFSCRCNQFGERRLFYLNQAKPFLKSNTASSSFLLQVDILPEMDGLFQLTFYRVQGMVI